MVAKPGSELPPLEVAVWAEPEQPAHPLTGLVAALERAARGPVVVLACDMPFVPPQLIARLARLDAVAAAPPGRGVPGPLRERRRCPRCAPASSARRRCGRCWPSSAPAEVAAGEDALLGINDPATLARAAALLR